MRGKKRFTGRIGVFEILLLVSVLIVYFLTSKQEISEPSLFSLLIALGVAFVIVSFLKSPTFLDRFVPKSDGRILGLLRIAAAGMLLVHLFFIMEFFETIRLPNELIRKEGFLLLEQLPGYDLVLAYPEIQMFIYILAAVSLLLAFLGYRAKIFIPLSVLFYVLARGFFLHYYSPWSPGLLGVYALTTLAFLPCSDRYSLDAYLKKRKSKRSSDEYGFSLYILWIVIAGTYLSLGLSKIRDSGLMWAAPENIRGYLLEWGYRYDAGGTGSFFANGMNDFLVGAPEMVFIGIGIFVLFLQLVVAPLALVSVHARIVFPILALFFSMMIFIIMGILFLDFILIPFVAFLGHLFFLRRSKREGGVVSEPATLLPKRYFAVLFGVLFVLLFQWHGYIKSIPLSPWNLFSAPSPLAETNEWSRKKVRVHYTTGTSEYIDPIQILGIYWYPNKCVGRFECEVFFNHLAESMESTASEKEIDKFSLEVVLYAYDKNARAFEPVSTSTYEYPVQK